MFDLGLLFKFRTLDRERSRRNHFLSEQSRDVQGFPGERFVVVGGSCGSHNNEEAQALDHVCGRFPAESFKLGTRPDRKEKAMMIVVIEQSGNSTPPQLDYRWATLQTRCNWPFWLPLLNLKKHRHT